MTDESTCGKFKKSHVERYLMPEIKPTQTRIINTFVDKMMVDKDLGAMSTEEREALRKNLRQKAEEQIEQAMLAALPDKKLLELEQLVDAGASDDALDDFFANCGVDFTKAAEQAMVEFRKAFLNSTVGEA